SSSRAGAGNDPVIADSLHRRRGHVNASGKARVIGEEGEHLRKRWPAEHLDVGTAAWAGACDDIEAAIAIDIAHRDIHAAKKSCRVGEERCIKLGLHAGENLDMWPTTLPCPGDDVEESIAIDIGGGDINAAGEIGVVGEEVGKQG